MKLIEKYFFNMSKYIYGARERKYKKIKMTKYNIGREIHDRSLDVLLRLEFDHLEVDILESYHKCT